VKQVLQSLKDGKTDVADVPCPVPGAGEVLVRTRRSLISAGTERMLVDFGSAGWIEKARQQPEKVGMVLEKIKADGLLPTIQAVRNKLDQPLAMGYCNVGTVIEVGTGVSGFSPGDRVASNGRHAEVVSVPHNLCARVPGSVSDDAAAFTVMGAIALQGIRLLQPTLGEGVVVTGLGLVGLLAVQLLRAHGCRVLGLDFARDRLELARSFGADVVDLSAGEDPVSAAEGFSRGRGVDAVLLTASTPSSDPVHQAALMCRKRGRIVLVGVTGLELSRADFYEKELTFQVSCSYGPGRYDPAYEQQGHDYPVGYVRWTEQRNFEAVLDMLADKRLDAAPLISHRFPIGRAGEAYALIAGAAPSLGVLLEYPTDAGENALSRTIEIPAKRQQASQGRAIGFVGAGNYANGTLMPAFRKAGARLKVVASGGGLSGATAARRHGFEVATSDVGAVFSDVEVAAVVIATRNDSHGRYVVQALESGKHVFVEKPLALTKEDVNAVEHAASVPGSPILMVGFNRRFAPHVVAIKALIDATAAPKAFVMTVNAGAVSAQHWTRDPESGGGRIVGEACHFIDLLRYLAGSVIVEHQVAGVKTVDACVTLSFRFADGSTGTVHYLSNGHRSFPKERLEVFCGGRILQLDNFRVLRGFGWPGFRTMRLWRQDKGQRACVDAFLAAIREGKPSPIPLAELIEVAKVTLAVSAAATA
jgi:predicted dehydrogenase/threonine dehydrogenase-like Zn-dependent dehydrogenase